MDWLDELIKENKKMFSTDEPLEGHFGRFEERLRRERKRKQMRLVYRISSIAAIGILLVVSSILLYERFSDQQPVAMQLGDVNPQLSRVEYYYTSQINQASIGIDSLSIYSNETTQSLMTNELAKMDSLHTVLSRQLGQYPGDERVINAMISYYQTKLKIMQNFLAILDQIKQEKQSKDQNYETRLL